jgi:mono/diheme cytochrome c family protein
MPAWRKSTEALSILVVMTMPALAWAADADCRDCHLGANPATGARDFGSYYGRAEAHHPVGVDYPMVHAFDAAFHRPSGRADDIQFFDDDTDGVPDEAEVRVYGALVATVECASCHRAHGGEAAASGPAAYLRIDNRASALCGVCHRR